MTSQADQTYSKQNTIQLYKYNMENMPKLLSELSAKDRKLLMAFGSRLQAQGISEGRIYKSMIILNKIILIFGFDPQHIEIKNVEAAVGKINVYDFSANTKHDYKSILKKFIAYVQGDKYDARNWLWIKTRISKREKKMPAEGDILSVEEIEKMINHASNTRDKALIAVLYESGARPSEILTLRYGDVKSIKKDVMVINIQHSKTMQRPVALVDSVPYINAWLNIHPRRDDNNAPLWSSSTNNDIGIGLQALHKMLLIVGERAGLCQLIRKRSKEEYLLKIKSGKRIYPYLFRHTRISHMLQNPKLPQSTVKRIVGWTDDSEMISTYLHMSNDTVQRIYLESHGIIESGSHEEETNLKKPIICPRPDCKRPNPHGSKICMKCNTPLDENIRTDIEMLVDAYFKMKDKRPEDIRKEYFTDKLKATTRK